MVDENRQSDPPPTAPPPPPPQAGDAHAPPAPQNPAVLHEHSDAKLRPILWIMLVTLVFSGITLYVIYRFCLSYEDYQAKIKASHYPLSSERANRLPEGPRLEQINRMADIQKGNVYLREESKESVLRSYGSAGDGYVHIPIEKAMDMLAEKLPARKEEPTAEQVKRQNGLVDAGASNSGRMFRGDQP